MICSTILPFLTANMLAPNVALVDRVQHDAYGQPASVLSMRIERTTMPCCHTATAQRVDEFRSI